MKKKTKAKPDPDPLLLTTAKESEKKFFGIYREDDIGVVEGMHIGTNEAQAESLVGAIAYPATRRRRSVFLVEMKIVRVIKQYWEGPSSAWALLLLMPHAVAAIGVERWFA